MKNEASIHIIFLNIVSSEVHFIAYLSIRYNQKLIQYYILKYATIQSLFSVYILKYYMK